MASKSRGRKTGTPSGTTRKSKQAKQSDDVLVSSGELVVLDTTAAADGAANGTADGTAESAVGGADGGAVELSNTPTKPVRRRSRKVAESAAAADEHVPPAAPKRSRKTAPKGQSSRKKAVETAPVAEVEHPATFVEAFADAFLYTPEPEPEPEPASAPEPTFDSKFETTFEGGAEPVAEVESAQPVTAETPVDLPFIVDIPREVVAPEEVKAAAEWVDQVLEPTKVVSPPRPRERAATVRPAARAAAKAAPRSSAKAAKSPAAALEAALNPSLASKPAAKPSARSASDAAPATRWWLVLPVFLVAAVLLFANRPGKKHAPVPEGVLGTWTTAFWLYEHQTLEIKPDTVVATLDETDEGRFPITAVETSDAGRELLVKITYRNDRGDEKVLDFLADKEPTTALRFRAHSGLVWVKAE
jgi:hypothetical protein